MHHGAALQPFSLAYRVISHFLPALKCLIHIQLFYILSLSREKLLECSKGFRRWDFRGQQQRIDWSHPYGQHQGISCGNGTRC